MCSLERHPPPPRGHTQLSSLTLIASGVLLLGSKPVQTISPHPPWDWSSGCLSIPQNLSSNVFPSPPPKRPIFQGSELSAAFVSSSKERVKATEVREILGRHSGPRAVRMGYIRGPFNPVCCLLKANTTGSAGMLRKPCIAAGGYKTSPLGKFSP